MWSRHGSGVPAPLERLPDRDGSLAALAELLALAVVARAAVRHAEPELVAAGGRAARAGARLDVGDDRALDLAAGLLAAAQADPRLGRGGVGTSTVGLVPRRP